MPPQGYRGQIKAKLCPDMKWMLSCPLTLKPEGPNTESRAHTLSPAFSKRLPQHLSHTAAPHSYCILPSCKSNKQEAQYQMLFQKGLNKFFLLFHSTGPPRAIADTGKCKTNTAARTTRVRIEWLRLTTPPWCPQSTTHHAVPLARKAGKAELTPSGSEGKGVADVLPKTAIKPA